MALPAGRMPASASATHVRRYQPPSGCGARSSAAMSDSPGRTAPVCLPQAEATPRLAATASECAAAPPKSAPSVVARLT